MPQVRFLPSWYFNSQPHMEADDLEASVFCPACDISTHSLTRRLTQVCKWSKQADCISTHSLTRRLTFSDFSSFLSTQFQLTASQGG